MKKQQLHTVAKIIAGQSPPSSTYNSTGDGLPFFQGKADFQEKYPRVRMWCNSGRAKEAKPGDILMSVRAPVGSVNICDQKSIIGRGLSAIRANSMLDANFLYFFLKSNERAIASLGTGSTFKAITQDTLKKVEIPLPSLDDQIRIAHLLGKVEGLIAQRKQNLLQLDDLLKSVFLEMFGDPVRNEKGWDTEKLGVLAFVERGRFSPRPRNDPKYFNGAYPFVQTGDINRSNGRLNKYTQTLNDLGSKVSKEFKIGTIVIAIVGATIGETAVLEIATYAPDSVIGITPKKQIEIRDSIFIEYILRFWKPVLKARAPEAARANINIETLRPLPIIRPKDAEVIKFVSIVDKVESIKSCYQESLSELETLYGALSQKAFIGELDLSKVPLPDKELNEQPKSKVTPELLSSTHQLKSEGDATVERLIDGMRIIEKKSVKEFSTEIFEGFIKSWKGKDITASGLWSELVKAGFADSTLTFDLFKKLLIPYIEKGNILSQVYTDSHEQVTSPKERRIALRIRDDT